MRRTTRNTRIQTLIHNTSANDLLETVAHLMAEIGIMLIVMIILY